MDKVQQFFQRIGMDPFTRVEMTEEFLGVIQSNCFLTIPYENLDILAGKALNLDGEALFQKIVINDRGGYCFEVNGLLAYMLRKMGFSVTERFARFLPGEPSIPMRRHRVVIVTLNGCDYMMDIGVAMTSPRLPLKVEAELIQTQNGETYRFRRDERHGWMLSDLHNGSFKDYLCFTDDIVYDIDFLQPSFFCEKHPDSIFIKNPIVCIKTPDGYQTTDGKTYNVFRGDTLIATEENISTERYQELLTKEFKLNISVY